MLWELQAMGSLFSEYQYIDKNSNPVNCDGSEKAIGRLGQSNNCCWQEKNPFVSIYIVI